MIIKRVPWSAVEPYADVVAVDRATRTAVIREPELPDATGNLLRHFTLDEVPDGDRP